MLPQRSIFAIQGYLPCRNHIFQNFPEIEIYFRYDLETDQKIDSDKDSWNYLFYMIFKLIRFVHPVDMQEPISISAFRLLPENGIDHFRLYLIWSVSMNDIDQIGSKFGNRFILAEIFEVSNILIEIRIRYIPVFNLPAKIPAKHHHEIKGRQ